MPSFLIRGDFREDDRVEVTSEEDHDGVEILDGSLPLSSDLLASLDDLDEEGPCSRSCSCRTQVDLSSSLSRSRSRSRSRSIGKVK